MIEQLGPFAPPTPNPSCEEPLLAVHPVSPAMGQFSTCAARASCFGLWASGPPEQRMLVSSLLAVTSEIYN